MFNLEEALKAVASKPEFGVYDRGTYTVIDYNVTIKDTFKGSTDRETLILQNLRGAAFDNATGKLISLPYHKFHNLNECEGYMDHEINMNLPHSIELKMDGSMIRMIQVPGGYVLGTRAGVTEVSRLASNFVLSMEAETFEYWHSFFEFCLGAGLTPIMEFCSRANKIVVDYPTPSLTVTAIRSMDDGRYLTHTEVKYVAGEIYRLPVVQQRRINFAGKTVKQIAQEIYSFVGNEEGIVIKFDEKFVKIKSEDYCRRHGAMDSLSREKNVLKMYLEGTLDDVVCLVDQDTRDRVDLYTGSVFYQMSMSAMKLIGVYNEYLERSSNRVEFAHIVNSGRKEDARFLFAMYGKEIDLFYVIKLIKAFVLKHTGSQPQVDSVREYIGPPYDSFVL